MKCDYLLVSVFVRNFAFTTNSQKQSSIMLPFVGLLLWTCVIIAISIILGLIGVLIALLVTKKPKRKRKLLLAFLSPGLAIGI